MPASPDGRAATPPASERVRVRRLPDRGRYDRDTVHAILDAAVVCHIGYVVEGQPYVTPTTFWREDDHVYWHGSSASRMLRALEAGVPCCFTVTLFDGLVLARSGFHHSANYRAVMALGTARAVTDEAAKARALDAFVERLYPGRVAELRPPHPQEIKGTTVLGMSLAEASAKVRKGPPKDDEEDYDWPVWAGVVPVRLVAGAPEPDPRLRVAVPVPGYLGAQPLG
ncbi:MAG: pyridoxamine 5'-phosphate oxidase family protein [Gemmatimonadales bacterium]|nr:pyridoxamine 5'-phosphate oxidase family protein [Gemmatimonadales bacterium]